MNKPNEEKVKHALLVCSRELEDIEKAAAAGIDTTCRHCEYAKYGWACMKRLAKDARELVVYLSAERDRFRECSVNYAQKLGREIEKNMRGKQEDATKLI